MVLTKEQKEILIGMILGDATLEKNGNYVRLRVDHSRDQKDYLEWKHQKLKGLTSGKPRLVLGYHSKVDKVYQKWHFSTYTIRELNKYWEIFYKQNRKAVPVSIRKLLYSPLSLAVWYMDDGYKRNDCNALRISTDSFLKYEQKYLVKCLKDNFGIESRLHKKGERWNIYIPQSQSEKFCKIIKPYIVPSMNYKITLTP